MIRHSSTAVLLVGLLAWAAGGIAVRPAGTAAESVWPVGEADAPPRPVATQARLERLVAASFAPHAAAVELEQVASEPVSLRDRLLRMQGRLRLAEGAAWLPFRAEAVADAGLEEATVLALTLEGEASATASAHLRDALRERLRERLTGEFAAQAAEVELTDIRVRTLDGRHLRVQADARAGFGADGTARAEVVAVWDEGAAHWRRFEYALAAVDEG